MVENLPTNAGDDITDVGSIPGLGKSPGGEHDNLLQYSCLGNPMNKGTWQAMVHEVAVWNMTEAIQHACTFLMKFTFYGRQAMTKSVNK